VRRSAGRVTKIGTQFPSEGFDRSEVTVSSEGIGTRHFGKRLRVSF
jgi:hypothetical protein